MFHSIHTHKDGTVYSLYSQFIFLFILKGTCNLNPIPYHAEYMGHKLHMDQNEKIGMFGATHVVAVDGFSSRIVAHATMPIKNNLIIYEKVYR